MKKATLFIALLSLGCGTYGIANATAATVQNTKSVTTSNTSKTIDCNYVITGSTNNITPEIITQWASNATLQTFTYDYKNIQQQFDQLKTCYTPEGWQSFSKAMQESKNMQTIQQQQLSVLAQLNGKSQISNNNDSKIAPTWEVTVPIKVSYKNATKNLSQDLVVKVMVSLNKGNQTKLAINQIIAASQQPPSQPEQPTTATAPAPSTPNGPHPQNNMMKPQTPPGNNH